MKRNFFPKLLIVIFLLSMLAAISACNSKKQNYYSQRENYVSAMGTISYIAYNKENTALYLDFSELTPTFSDTCFKIVGDNIIKLDKQ